MTGIMIAFLPNEPAGRTKDPGLRRIVFTIPMFFFDFDLQGRFAPHGAIKNMSGMRNSSRGGGRAVWGCGLNKPHRRMFGVGECRDPGC
eukprot:7368851-Pyramimonas_sp.AAC.1